MKKLLAVLTLLTLSFSAHAEGVYDGIWQSSSGNLISVTTQGEEIILVVIDLSNDSWRVFQGDLEGASAVVSRIASLAESTASIEFMDETATVTIDSCTVCNRFSVGTELTWERVFGG